MDTLINKKNISFVIINIIVNTLLFIICFKISNINSFINIYFSIYILIVLVLGILKWKSKYNLNNRITLFLLINGIVIYSIYLKTINNLKTLEIEHYINLFVFLIFIILLLKIHLEKNAKINNT
jgi:hypothetical protein